ncbi:HD domain-containing protein [Paenibacillus sp. FSL H7-0331]|uniref:HD domain-containing protein n=1 Tax=Paenibacillus sp. FSL H7-0331 TaxID=1920421 RepID=UPI00096E4BF8|nr:HD domain-containing protein [Paenibacillus sp. FSL H7-0331]OMF08992.1 HAD family hydrolase [Paenibacillus sp. FSL H7-0331]
MHSIFKDVTQNIQFTGDLKQDIHLFLSANNCSKTAEHCMDVGTEARRIALLFNANPEAAEISGWLHDISAVFPNNQRIAVSRELQIEVLPEEEFFPMIIHQKLSKAMATDIFKITDTEILDAVGCHTTLRARSTILDQVLFVADKVAWDQPGEPPYNQELQRSLKISLAHGAFSYIQFLWERKETLKVVHSWLKEAYEEMKHLENINHSQKRFE